MYRYPEPVALGPHTLRLRPREDPAQRLLSYSLRLDPVAAGSSGFLDQEGNPAVRVWFVSPVTSLAIYSRFEVETLRSNPFDFLLEGSLRIPMEYPEALRAVLAPYTQPAPAASVEAFAREAAEAAGWGTLDFLTLLSRRIFESLRYVIRDWGRPLSAAQTLEAGEGSCRDFAVLFAEACRHLGLAARFVSGYETAAASSERADMHAWAEVYLPGGGWRGYDPSRGLAVADSHVAVAASLAPELAAPVTGTHGGAGSRLETAIRLTVS
jgi:transglutaminase-like putative cysteine protease